jgi:hypothetical protein
MVRFLQNHPGDREGAGGAEKTHPILQGSLPPQVASMIPHVLPVLLPTNIFLRGGNSNRRLFVPLR